MNIFKIADCECLRVSVCEGVYVRECMWVSVCEWVYVSECMWVSEWICVLWKSKTNMGLGDVGRRVHLGQM